MTIPNRWWVRMLLAGLSASLVGCGSAGLALGQSTVAVGVHGVNYTNETFSYIVKDPENEGNSAGGELVSRFTAGGLMCCYALPRKWRPGLKVVVRSTHWLNEKVNGNLPEFKKEFTVEIPQYAEPGELWILRLADGTVDVVSSDLSPIHPDWPGKIKGYPVPSAEYRAERRALARREAQRSLESFQNTLNEITINSETYTKRMWPKWQEARLKKFLKFSGPTDPALHEFLLRDTQSFVDFYKNKIESIDKGAE
jgi:hypothetical protein